MRPFLRLLPPLILASLACRSENGPQGEFSVSVPGVLRSALSGTALCDQLTARMTFGRTDVREVPAINNELLQYAGNCSWNLSNAHEIVAGTYEMQIPFTYGEKTAPPGTCNGPILVGMFYQRNIAVPLNNFQADAIADWYTQNSPFLQNDAGVAASFDEDGDGRSNLAEVIDGTDPCVSDAPPTVTIDGLPDGGWIEGQPLSLTVTAKDLDGKPFQMQFSVRHQNGSIYPPETISVTIPTDYSGNDGGTGAVYSFSASQLTWKDQWALSIGDNQNALPGAGTWIVSFTPDEPFVGQAIAGQTDRSLILQAVTLDGNGEVLSGTDPTHLDVALDPNLDQPVAIVDGDVAQTLDFAEQCDSPDDEDLPGCNGNAPTVVQFSIEDARLGDPSNHLIFALGANPPAGLTLANTTDSFGLSWRPTNDQAAQSPIPVTFNLLDPTNLSPVSTVTLLLNVNPTYNNGPTFTPPVSQFVLPDPPPAGQPWPAGVWPATVMFNVQDPDQVDTPPTCTLDGLDLSNDSGCSNPFDTITCSAIVGSRVGPQWTFEISFAKGADYESCVGNPPGSDTPPSFGFTVHITDTPPKNSINGPQSLAGCDSELPNCNQIILRTVKSMTEYSITTTYSGSAAYLDGALPASAGGTMSRALVAGNNEINGNAFFMVDLAAASGTVSKTFLSSELDGASNAAGASGIAGGSRQYGATDVVNHRVLLTGGFVPGATDSDGLVVVDMTTMNVALALQGPAACNGLSQPILSNPVVDKNGVGYYLCASSSGVWLMQIDSQNHITRLGTSDGYDASWARTSALVESTKTWFISDMQRPTFRVFDLSSSPPAWVDLPDPNIDSGYNDYAVDNEHGAFLYAYQGDSGDAVLGRVVFSPSPAVAAPLTILKASGSSPTMVLRRPAATPQSPNLFFDPGANEEDPSPFTMETVDLASLSVTQLGVDSDYHLNTAGPFGPTPDHRYFLLPAYSNDSSWPAGFKLYRFDGQTSKNPALLEEPDMSPCTGVNDVISSNEGSVSIVLGASCSEYGNPAAQIFVLHFPAAAAGTDQ